MNRALLRKLEAMKARRLADVDALDSLLSRGEEIKNTLHHLPEVLKVLYQISLLKQKRTFEHFENICNLCLLSIFEDPYQVKLVGESKRNQFEVRIECAKGGEVYDPSNDEVEGGVLDVISFALRLAYISLSGCRRILILDEPFKWVDSDARARLRECLEKLSSDLGFQIILVTHLPELIDENSIIL